MIVLVCGGRDYTNKQYLFSELDSRMRMISKIVSGGAKGADTLAELWARERGIPIAVYRADWKKHGKAAGPIRNMEMLKCEAPDLVLAFPGGKGTANMILLAQQAYVKVEKLGWYEPDR